ncbi:MAG: VWA domain-containing protein, partial [Deltaproteobacteria bacterium]
MRRRPERASTWRPRYHARGGRAPAGLRRTVAPERPADLSRRGGGCRAGDAARRLGGPRRLPRRASRDAGQARPGRACVRPALRALFHRRQGSAGRSSRVAPGRARAREPGRGGARGSGADAGADVAAGAGARSRPHRPARAHPAAGDGGHRFPRPAEPAAARILRAASAAGGRRVAGGEGSAAASADAAAAGPRSRPGGARHAQGLADAEGARGFRPARGRSRSLLHRNLSSLTADEVQRMRAVVRRLAERLKARLSRRRKVRRRGHLSVRRTLRKNLSTGGEPYKLVFRARRPERPEIVVLCDVSDSVRNVSRLMLQFVYTLQELYARVRSFVFVSDIGEVTDLFKKTDVSTAVDLATAGRVINLSANSNYGHALKLFHGTWLG